MEWLEEVYEAVGAANHPTLSLIIVMVIGALLSGGIWWVISQKYQREHSQRKVSVANNGGATNQAGQTSPSSLPHNSPAKPEHNARVSTKAAAPPTTVINAPQGIGISGGNVTNPTVNNFAPPARRLSEPEKALLVACAAQKPAKFTVSALANNMEAYNYAQDWLDVLTQAGWENQSKEIPIRIFSIGGGMWTGMHINVHNTLTEPDRVALLGGSPEQNFVDCLASAKIIASAIGYPTTPTGSADIFISQQ